MKITLIAAAALVLAGCSYDISKSDKPTKENDSSTLGDIASADLSYPAINQNIIQSHCIGCHRAPRNSGGINLESYDSLVRNRDLIDRAVDTFFMPDAAGGSMPDEKRAILLRWIELGTPFEAPQAASSFLIKGLEWLAGPKALAAIDPSQWKVKPGSEASFEAIGSPSLLRINAKGAPVTGKFKIDDKGQVTGDFELALAEFETGIGLRDRHMKEKYLETDKFPKSTLKITRVELPKEWKPGDEALARKFDGQLTLKDKTQAVKGVVDIHKGDMNAEARFNINLENYPVGVPSYLGVTVANEVKIKVNIKGFERL